MEFKDKFVGFIDILGFKKLIEAHERGESPNAAELQEIVAALGTPKDRDQFVTYGPMICPNSSRQQKDIDFHLLQISDCVILSAEISPAGVINLVGRAWSAAIRLLQKGLMCRGYITRGKIHHTANQVFGTGYHHAYSATENSVTIFKKLATEKGTPFIEIDSEVVNYVDTCGDSCVAEMFGRLTRREGAAAAVFPFQRLQHSFALAPFFNAEESRKSNSVLRGWIRDYRARVEKHIDATNPRAVEKGRHYLEALDAQLRICDQTDQVLDMLQGSFPR